MAKILIIGGGFGGLVVAERLATELDGQHQITLVAERRKFTFYPALVHLAFGECEESDITFDLATRLGEIGIRFIEGELIGVEPERRVARVTGKDVSGDLSYDFIVFAMGRRLATEQLPGFFEYANHLLGVGAAKAFGDKIRDFREGTIIVGACPDSRLPVPVCETAFALARKFEKAIADGRVRIKVIFPESLKKAFGGAELHKQLESAFERHGINVLYDIPISHITASQVHSSLGHAIDYDLLMLTPPFRGHAMLDDLGITDEQHYIRADGHLRVPGLANSYAVGDIVAFSGPKLAHMAVRQAEMAASDLIARFAQKELTDEYYHEIATIIDAGGADSIYLHYGIWDDELYRVKKGHFWGWAKTVHDKVWRARHS